MSTAARIRRELDHLRALDVARDALRTWEQEQRAAEFGWRHEPLPKHGQSERRAVVDASGLRAAGPMGNFIADVLVDGVVSRETYTRWVYADTGDPAELVERVLPRMRAGAFRDAARAIPAAVRKEVLDRDGKTCQLAHTGGCDVREKLALDHLVPWVYGGPSESSNLWPLCHPGHNLEKLAHFPGRETLLAWLEGGRTLPACYGEALRRRPWQAWESKGHDAEQTWEDEVRTINRQLKRARRQAEAAWWAEWSREHSRCDARLAAALGA